MIKTALFILLLCWFVTDMFNSFVTATSFIDMYSFILVDIISIYISAYTLNQAKNLDKKLVFGLSIFTAIWYVRFFIIDLFVTEDWHYTVLYCTIDLLMIIFSSDNIYHLLVNHFKKKTI